MRKILTALLATMALIAVAQPASAQAACSNWSPDTNNRIYQNNGWWVILWYDGNYWQASAFYPGMSTGLHGDVYFHSWSASAVTFTITWSNASAGIYRGSIDEYGFITGTSEDRWTGATTTWRMRDPARCIG